MTHEELLAKLDEIDKSINVNFGTHLLISTIRAVVILHKPVYNEYFAYYDNQGCFACNEIWPCYTIEVIQKALND